MKKIDMEDVSILLEEIMGTYGIIVDSMDSDCSLESDALCVNFAHRTKNEYMPALHLINLNIWGLLERVKRACE